MEQGEDSSDALPTITDIHEDGNTRNSKRLRLNSSIEEWRLKASVIPIDRARSLTRISPFVVARDLHEKLGSVKTTTKKGHALLIECYNIAQLNKLLDITSIHGVDVKVVEGDSFGGGPKGVVTGIPQEVTEEEMIVELKNQKVSHAKRIKKTQNGKSVTTTAFVLTENLHCHILTQW